MIQLRSAAIATVYGFAGLSALFAQGPVQKCTVQSIRGIPVAGVVCGGSSHGLNCTAGALYQCKSGPAGTQNNCTLSKACAIGCLTNGSGSQLNDSCFSGTAPLTVSPLNTAGGNDLALTVHLADTHPNGAIVNLTIDRGDIVPGAACAAPNLAAGQTSESFGLSTAVVPSTATAHIFTDIAYSDAAGTSRELISLPQTVTLSPGGTAPPPPPISSFMLTPSTIGPAGVSFMDVTLSRMAPASGVQIIVSISDPSVASVIPSGQPFILGSCLTGGGAATIQAANSVSQQTTLTIGASSGAAGQSALTQPLTVTTGCVPNACSGGPSCGPQPDGCGGTQICSCTNLAGQTCGGGGIPNQCGPPVLAVTSLTLNPSTVTSGSSSAGNITLNMPAPSGGALVTLSSSNSFITVPPSVTVGAGQTGTGFTANTATFPSGTVSAQISAARGDTVEAILTVNGGGVCTPTTCAAQGKNCGSISDGCGGTLTCGTCGASETCGGGGVLNVCALNSGTVALTLTATGHNGTVTSTPSGLSVLTGHTATANFNAGTSITLQSNDSKGVIWSGVCSSNNRPAQSCNFVLNGAGSESANLQLGDRSLRSRLSNIDVIR